MSLSQSKLVPAMFWVGFVALGLFTSMVGPDRRHPHRAGHAAPSVMATEALADESIKIVPGKALAPAAID